MQGLSPAVASGGHSSSRCAGLSLSRPLLLRSTGSRRAGSVVVAHGLSCSAARGILPDQGSNPCPLHRQADSQPLRHQGSPRRSFRFKLPHSRYLEIPCHRLGCWKADSEMKISMKGVYQRVLLGPQPLGRDGRKAGLGKVEL